MAKKEVVWSLKAQSDFEKIFSFYLMQTGSSKYPLKLLRMIESSLKLISVFPFMYRATTRENTRVFVCEYFKVFYLVTSDIIFVESIFDSRQNPDKNQYE